MAMLRDRVGMSFASWPSIHTFPEVGLLVAAMIATTSIYRSLMDQQS
jgi:hypothetical protein